MATLLDVFNELGRLGTNVTETWSREKKYIQDKALSEQAFNLSHTQSRILQKAQDFQNNPEGYADYIDGEFDNWFKAAQEKGDSSRYYLDNLGRIGKESQLAFKNQLFQVEVQLGRKKAVSAMTEEDQRLANLEDPDLSLEMRLKNNQEAFDAGILNPLALQQENSRATFETYNKKISIPEGYGGTTDDWENYVNEVYSDLRFEGVANRDKLRDNAVEYGIKAIQDRNFARHYREEVIFQDLLKNGDPESMRLAANIAATKDPIRDAVIKGKGREYRDEQRGQINGFWRMPKERDAGGGRGFDFEWENLARLVYIQSQQSGLENGALAGITFNEAVDRAVEEARGFFDTPIDENAPEEEKKRIQEIAGMKENQFRTTAVYEIGKDLLSKYINNTNLVESNIFRTLTQDSKTFMNKQMVANLTGKQEADITQTEITQAQEDLWASVMDVIAEVGTAQGNRDILNERINAIYATYTDKKFVILRDNAQSESTWTSGDYNKTAQALRLINEESIYNPGYNQSGRTGKGHLDYGENINDTVRAAKEEGAVILARSLGWENDGKTTADISGKDIIMTRGDEAYRIIGRKTDGRETLVIQKWVDGEWKDAPDKKAIVDTRKGGEKIIDALTTPQGKATPGPTGGLRTLNGPGGQFQWGGASWPR